MSSPVSIVMLFLFIAAVVLPGIWGLRDVAIRVPEATAVGDTAKLVCDYDLEKAALYSIKWYRGDKEFYSFVPKESPPTRVFPVEGVHVDLSLSNSREVTLRDVQRDASAFYKCEVSADLPFFHTVIKSAPMIVAELPSEDPSVYTEKLKYSLGEKIRANCTSPLSFPVVNLTWFINGKNLTHWPQSRQTPGPVELDAGGGGLERLGVTLEVEASSTMFKDGKLRLRCLSTLFHLDRRTHEIELSEDTPQLAPVMGPTAPHSHSVPDEENGHAKASWTGPLALEILLLVAAAAASR